MFLLYILLCKDDEWINEDPNEENIQIEFNVEQDVVIVNNVVEVDVVVNNDVQSGGDGCGNVEICGSRTSSNLTLVNDEEGDSSGV